MKHAGPATLAQLEPLLAQLRALSALSERTPGCFYRKGTAWLHFHEDPTGLFADAKLGGKAFERVRVTSAAEQALLLRKLRASV